MIFPSVTLFQGFIKKYIIKVSDGIDTINPEYKLYIQKHIDDSLGGSFIGGIK